MTTSPETCGRVERALRAAGLEPVCLPCITVRPAEPAQLARVRRNAAAADWILLTSARTVSIVWPDGQMPPVPVAAVGPATAAAAEAAGGRVELVGDGGGTDLGLRLKCRVDGQRVVLPHGALADGAISHSLQSGGAEVQSFAVYDTLPIAPGDTPVDAVVFGSPSAVAGWCRSRSLDGVLLAALGPTTAATLEDLGHPPHVIPDHPNYDRVARALAARAGERSRT